MKGERLPIQEQPQNQPPEQPEQETVQAIPEAVAEQRQELAERQEFFEGMQREEQGTVGTILSKFTEVPKALKRGIMMLAAAGAILSTSEAFASDAFAKNYEGWQKHFAQKGRVEQTERGAEMQKQRAYNEYKLRVMQIQQAYEQYKIRAMTERVHDLPVAIKQLDAWKQQELHKARFEWMGKAWAAQEEYRLKGSR